MLKMHQSINNKNPKVYFKQYLNNINEPAANIFDDDLSPELSVEFLENSFTMKHRIRQLAKKMRRNNNH